MAEAAVSLGEWVKIRRNLLGLPRKALAERAAVSPDTIKKIGADFRRPSRQVAELLPVLDNCEHLPGVTPLLGKALAQGEGVCLLATSRTKLGLQDEHLFRIEGMP